MLLEDGITVVSINKGIVPHDQRREQLALFQDIFFKLLKFIIGQRRNRDRNSGSIFRLIIRTLLYLLLLRLFFLPEKGEHSALRFSA